MTYEIRNEYEQRMGRCVLLLDSGLLYTIIGVKSKGGGRLGINDARMCVEK